MKLRARLLLAGVLILVVVGVGGLAIVNSQERYLVGQLDEQLHTTRPLLGPPRDRPASDSPPPEQPSEENSGEGQGEGSGGGFGDNSDKAPVSNLYVGQIVDGELTTILQGQLLDDSPSISSAKLNSSSDEPTGPFTTRGQEGNSRFRAILITETDTGSRYVVALPRDEVDQAISQLRSVLFGGAAIIAVVLGLSAWWVDRLGLRPVAHVTEVAVAITQGARGLRAEQTTKATEANQLAAAFNVMLDEHDATEQRLRSFISDASHELRTPLTSIRGYLDLYSDGAFRQEGELDDVVRRLQRESLRMQSLVEDLLLLAKLDEHPEMTSQLRSGSVDVAQILEDAAADAGVLQADRPITVEVAPGLPQCQGDTLRIQQVIGILVSNALAHTKADVALHLSAHSSGDKCIIEVRDQGPGLDAKVAEKVFDRFYRGDPSRARSTGGSGLGLAIAKSIVEAHNGEIALETAPGKGCKFTVKLPSSARSATR
ncbi:MAG: HAMP domain-containing histidine kinase [Acidimicrobiales bacterium]|nr:HAMP domain-containing histidine kinase [Acidimicrobiales bacterium]